MLHYLREVRVVNVGIYSKQAFKDGLDYCFKAFGERRVQLQGENVFIIQLEFNPECAENQRRVEISRVHKCKERSTRVKERTGRGKVEQERGQVGRVNGGGVGCRQMKERMLTHKFETGLFFLFFTKLSLVFPPSVLVRLPRSLL